MEKVDMEKVEILDDQVVSLDDIASGLKGLRIIFVNVFGVSYPDGTWTLIDAAVPHCASRIRSWAEKNFGGPPNAIILTHGHFDHVGTARELAEAWGVKIFAHPLEFPYLTGKREYDGPNWKAGGGLMSLLSPLYPKSPIDLGERLEALPGEGSELSLAHMPGWKLLHTPGHTPGHVSFFRESDRTLLVGDAFCTTKPESFFEAAIAQQPELHGPPSYFTSNWADAKASVRKLAALDPVTVAVGHGKPLSGEHVPERLQVLADAFDEIAVPENVKINMRP